MNNKIDLSVIRENGEVVGTKKMNINGVKKNMEVFRIPLDQLYYNDQNDRIATYISKYNSENKSITDLPLEERNNIIEKYIISSDKEKFIGTKNNIEQFSQLEPGVVLTDGRVIDGNRRFTCLRVLHRETGKQEYNYFEAVILDSNIDEKQIKIMELILQQGREERVDYNPIEKLVGIYRDIVKTDRLTVAEYANSIGTKISDVEKSVELAKLMEDFLEYINAPEEFYIAKDFKIDGPLNELYTIKKRIGSDEEKWNKVKITLYDNIIMKTKSDGSGDITRNIRDFGKKIVSNEEYFENYYEKHEPLSRKLNQKLNECEGNITTDYIRNNIRNDSELSEDMDKIFNEAIYSAKKDEIKNIPIETINSINNDLSKLDITAVCRLQGVSKTDFIKQLDILQNKINEIKEKVENGIN